MGYLLYICAAIATLIAYLWVKALKINRHWKEHGIPGPAPLPFFGNLLPMLIGQQNMGEIIKDMYEAYPNEPVVGFYHFMQPRLLIRDLSLIDRMFIKDFSHFHARQGSADVLNDPINSNLFVLNGNVWRAVRTKFAPMFTTGKLRQMFPHVTSVGDNFVEYLGRSPKVTESFKKMSTYTIDVISTTAFGMEPGPMDDENSEFRMHGRQVMAPGIFTFVRFFFIMVLPSLAQKLGVTIAPKATTNFFTSAVKGVLQHRKKTGATRNDFVQQMVILQQKGSIEIENPDAADDYLKIQNTEGMEIETSDDLMAGQAFAFLLAGFDTTAISLMMMIFNLAVYCEEQEKARAEVKKISDSLEGKLTLDAMKGMEYLEGCMKESLRMNSTVPMLFRRCMKEYKIPGVPYTLSVGENITISTYGMHMDPKFYPEPQKFSPERWMNDFKPPSAAFSPFGYGPRICIGMRLALSELKSVLAKLLLNYKMTLDPSVKLPQKTYSMSIFNQPAQNPDFIFEKI